MQVSAEQVGAPRRPWDPRLEAGFLALMVAILLVLTTKLQLSFLPVGLAVHIGHNSEVFVLAIGLGLALGGPQVRAQRSRATSVVVAVLVFGLGLFVFYGPLPGTLSTLNEPIFATSVLWLYAMLRRPLKWGLLASLLLLIVVVLGYHTQPVTLQAESLVALILAPISLDVADRQLADTGAPDLPWLRWGWTLLLLLIPFLLMLVKHHGAGGPLGEAIRYASRGTEGFWGLALVHLYFEAQRAVTRRSPVANGAPGAVPTAQP